MNYLRSTQASRVAQAANSASRRLKAHKRAQRMMALRDCIYTAAALAAVCAAFYGAYCFTIRFAGQL